MNEQIFFWFYNLGQAIGKWPVYFMASLLPWIFGLGLLVWFLAKKDKPRAFILALTAFASALVAWFLASLFKYNFFNPRPFEVLDILPVVTTGLGDALPSGHATFMSALAISIWLQNKKLGTVFVLGAVVVGLARIMAGVHWPIDVLGGWAWGGLIGYGLTGILMQIKTQING